VKRFDGHTARNDWLLPTAAEYLIAHGYTSARRLAGRGGSAGAVPVGGALVRRPDLFGAIVLEVPSLNRTRPADGLTRAQHDELTADILAFLLHELT